jgi:predicted PilT family ATPase
MENNWNFQNHSNIMKKIYSVENLYVCHIIGRNGRKIKEIETKYETKISIKKENKKSLITIKGKTAENITRTANRIAHLIAYRKSPSAICRFNTDERCTREKYCLFKHLHIDTRIKSR